MTKPLLSLATAVLIGGTAGAAQSDPPPPGAGLTRQAPAWRLTFADNPRLPPMFKQGAAPRADGSELTFFLGNFNDGLAQRRPLLVYLEGSGAQSQFAIVDGKVGFTLAAAEGLSRSRARLFIAHGSDDVSVPIESFDFLVAELLRRGRKDVTTRRYPGRDHSFMKTGAEPGYEGFLEVLDEVVSWA
jgi:acetyl esterase/lipase